MSSVEFTTKIEHGVIHLPKELEDYEDKVAHVTVTLKTIEDKKERKERLFAVLEKMKETDIFRDIDDPVEWQRKLRDEWE